MAFQMGEVVQLKSGGPRMTVSAVDKAANRVVCQWLKKADAKQSDFLPETLVSAPLLKGGIRVSHRPEWRR